MRYQTLGDSDIRVSVVALGCWGFAGGEMWGSQEEAESASTVAAALEMGVNLMDTAERYGNGFSEEVLGRALRGRRHEAVIATKVRGGDLSARGIQAACNRSLKRLCTDYIDLYQPHWPDRKTPPEETMQAMIRLREAGKIRAIGLSNFGVGDLSDILLYGKVVSNQLPYSLLWRAIEYEIQPFCEITGISILCYSPLLHGLLTGKYSSADEVPEGRARTRHFSSRWSLTRHGEEGCETQVFSTIDQIRVLAAEAHQPMPLVAVAWLLQKGGVASVIVGARRPAQIRQIAIAADLRLSAQIIDRLDLATDHVKKILGTNPDMWESESRFR